MHSTEIETKIAGSVVAVCRGAAAILDAAFASDSKVRVPVVKLSERLAGELGMAQGHVYQIVSMYIVARHDLEVKKGPGGGIAKIGA